MENERKLKEKLTNRVNGLKVNIEISINILEKLKEYISSYLSGMPFEIFGIKSDSNINDLPEQLKTIFLEMYQNGILEIDRKDINSLRKINKLVDNFSKEIEKMNKEKNSLESLAKVLDNFNVPVVVNELDVIFKVLLNILNTESLSKLLGLIITHNYKLMNNTLLNNNGVIFEESKKNLYKELAKYYKYDGSFKGNSDYRKYQELLSQLLLSNENLTEEEIKTINIFIESSTKLLKKQVSLINSNKIESNSVTTPKHTKQGPCLEASDYDLISFAIKLNNPSLDGILGEIDFIFREYENLQEEEQEYYNNELSELVSRLKEECKPYMIEKYEVVPELNKLIFLTNSEDRAYIEDDTRRFEGSQRKSIEAIFRRINKLSSSTKLTPILPINKDNPVFYLTDNSAYVAFTKVFDKYLVVGAGKCGMNYETIANRVVMEAKQIKFIKDLNLTDLDSLVINHSDYIIAVTSPSNRRKRA